jgi:imidazole glycerol-phosphate synthase subunit HisF
MGWNLIKKKKRSKILEDLDEDSRFYFLHSFYFQTISKDYVLAQTFYNFEFSSIINFENIYGIQFHPEKSHLNRFNNSKKFYKFIKMLNPRIIPVLLLENDRLVKTVKFSNPKYVGDPINTVRIFNEKQVDELFILKIDGNKNLNYSLLNKLASECRMPLCYGGGITSIDQVKKLISLGVEKISICSHAVENYFFIKEAIKSVGKQSVVITVDLKIENKIYIVTSDNGKKKHNIKFEDYLDVLQEINVGEILINLIDRDGTMEGYDLNLAEKVSKKTIYAMYFFRRRM